MAFLPSLPLPFCNCRTTNGPQSVSNPRLPVLRKSSLRMRSSHSVAGTGHGTGRGTGKGRGRGSGMGAGAGGTSADATGNNADGQPSFRNRLHNDAMKRAVELGWRFQMRESDQPSVCRACHGTGRVECSWCNATGVLMLGDRLICSIEGNCSCLVCDDGHIACQVCHGTGQIASWMVQEL